MSWKQNIANRRQTQRRMIEVPEWGENDVPFKLYVYPLTMHDLKQIQRKHKNFMNEQSADAMIDIIIMKSGDESGEKLFTLEDKADLMSEEINVIANIFNQMFGDVESVEQAEKN